MEMTDPTTATAVDELRRKQARRARWSRIGGGLLAAAFLIRGASALLTPAQAQACDASEVQSALTDLINEATAKGKSDAKVASITAIRTVSDDRKLMRCTGHVALSDKSEGTLTYHVDPKQVMIDKLD